MLGARTAQAWSTLGCDRPGLERAVRKVASPTGFERKSPPKPPSERVDQTRKDYDLGEEPADSNRRE